MFDFKEIWGLVHNRYLDVNKHKEEDLFIFNYSVKTQYEKYWNDLTLSCRGLILDNSGAVRARCLRKFFNLEEIPNAIPNEPFNVFDKLDGSLGILYWIKDKPFISTRGSFHSTQAEWASQFLHENHKETIKKLKQGQTYLFEIIYKTNRIVVDYGNNEGLTLLAIVDNKTGLDLPLEEIGFPLVKHHGVFTLNDIDRLKNSNIPNAEGYVFKFHKGLEAYGGRVKLKFDEYCRLHKILTNFSSKSIWDCLRSGQELEAFLANVPDEFYQFVRETEKDLRAKYAAIEKEAIAEFELAKSKTPHNEFRVRKEAATYFKDCKYPFILFSMLDGKDYSHKIWKLLEPEYVQPFRNQNQTQNDE